MFLGSPLTNKNAERTECPQRSQEQHGDEHSESDAWEVKNCNAADACYNADADELRVNVPNRHARDRLVLAVNLHVARSIAVTVLPPEFVAVCEPLNDVAHHLTRRSSAAATRSEADNLWNCFSQKKAECAAGSRRLQRLVR